MAPVATAVPEDTPASFSTSPLGKDVRRRPSPWHEIAHSLSATAVPSVTTVTRRRSSACLPATAGASIPHARQGSSPSPSPPLSSSQALREWEARLSQPSDDGRAIRHHLLHPSPSPKLQSSYLSAVLSPPKLAAERDKAGHIEYKLKLIEPSVDRFERLVTQMMWRLKQGKNEAIYELGLADDGTVVGLTRNEMDASLHTLELMASEVGATVLVLREVVLTGPVHPWRDSPAFSHGTPSSSRLSPVSQGICNATPMDGARQLVVSDIKASQSGRRAMAKQQWGDDSLTGEPEQDPDAFNCRVIFSAADLEEMDSDASSYASSPRLYQTSSTPDDEISTFELELEDPSPSSPSSPSSGRWGNKGFKPVKSAVIPKLSPAEVEERDRKSEQKRLKSAVKREQRRLDLLKGDGTSPIWSPLPSIPSDNPHLQRPVCPIPIIPHQPARPSSLRLITPASSSNSTSPSSDTIINDLLHLPLDSLSLSFADVQNLSPEDPRTLGIHSPTSSNDTEYTENAAPRKNPLGDRLGDRVYLPPRRGEEMICVEALVVRKVGYEEDGWYGGQEDAWGLSGGDDDDPWGFEE